MEKIVRFQRNWQDFNDVIFAMVRPEQATPQLWTLQWFRRHAVSRLLVFRLGFKGSPSVSLAATPLRTCNSLPFYVQRVSLLFHIVFPWLTCPAFLGFVCFFSTWFSVNTSRGAFLDTQHSLGCSSIIHSIAVQHCRVAVGLGGFPPLISMLSKGRHCPFIRLCTQCLDIKALKRKELQLEMWVKAHAPQEASLKTRAFPATSRVWTDVHKMEHCPTVKMPHSQSKRTTGTRHGEWFHFKTGNAKLYCLEVPTYR